MSTSFVGRVLSNKMDKSVVVAVQRIYKHPTYEKIVKKTKKFMAHDEANECNIGDVVKIVSTRPISKRKAFSVEEVVHRAFVFGERPGGGGGK